MPSPTAPNFPFDDALKGVEVLLDPERMRHRVQEGFGVHGRLARLRIRSFEYVPHVSLRVHYTAEVGTLRHDLSAQIGFPVPEQKEIERLTMSAKDRRVARLPVARMGDLAAHVSWYPVDFGLPLLSESDVEIADLVGLDSAGPTSQIEWLPGRYAVIRYPNAVVRVYNEPSDASRCVYALRLIDGHLPVARLTTKNEERGLVAQELRPGKPLQPEKAVAAGSTVGSFIAQLHKADTGTFDPKGQLVHLDRAMVLAAAQTTGDMVSFCVPELKERVDAVLAVLGSSADEQVPTVASHGSLSYGNIYQHGDSLHVPDADHLCFAPRAYDLATFAVSTISGRADDQETLNTVVQALAEGYGSNIDAMNWYLAAAIVTTLDRPLNGLARDWNERTANLLTIAEQRTA